ESRQSYGRFIRETAGPQTQGERGRRPGRAAPRRPPHRRPTAALRPAPSAARQSTGDKREIRGNQGERGKGEISRRGPGREALAFFASFTTVGKVLGCP